MAKYSSILDQLLRHISRNEFQQIVDRHQGDKRVRSFRCWNQFVCLFFGQLTGQHSLRDLVTAANSGLHKLRHVGVLSVSRSTLADANNSRPHEIYRELFDCLYQRCRRTAPGHGFGFAKKVYTLDATVIGLSLKVFQWAKFRATKGAIKLHLMLDLWGRSPVFASSRPVASTRSGRRAVRPTNRTASWSSTGASAITTGFTNCIWMESSS